MFKFNKHNVTNGTHKARVSYSAHRMVSTGAECVTLYAKDWQSGRTLDEMFAAGYENNTDSREDYFELGRVRILKSSPHYEAAYARAVAAGNA